MFCTMNLRCGSFRWRNERLVNRHDGARNESSAVKQFKAYDGLEMSQGCHPPAWTGGQDPAPHSTPDAPCARGSLKGAEFCLLHFCSCFK